MSIIRPDNNQEEVFESAVTAEGILMPGGNPIGTAGTGGRVRNLLGGLPKAQSVFAELTKGGQVTGDQRYPGTQV